MTNQTIYEHPCQTAEELWGFLKPERLQYDNLVYRGQRDCKWGLLPSAYRGQLPPEINLINSDHTAFSELLSVKAFVDACDRQGLGFYGDSPTLRSDYLVKLQPIHSEVWPPDPLINLLAICQHHGMPTRLLDWTTRSYVAVYFAASSALYHVAELLKQSSSELDGIKQKRMAIWAINRQLVSLTDGVKIVNVPGSVSPNLAAQSGVLMFRQEKIDRNKPFCFEALETYIPAEDCNLVKYTLPISEASHALELCQLYGITTASMFPGYDGAARHAVELETFRTVQTFLDFHDVPLPE